VYKPLSQRNLTYQYFDIPFISYMQPTLRRLLVAANVVPSSPILVTLMKEALGSSET
jgi:hypothetical protein